MMQVEGSGSIAVITAFSFSFLQLLFISSLFLSGISTDIDSGVNRWHIITKHNFSYEIRRHADILLMVTLPWSGESRALSEELTHDLSWRRYNIGGLRLMLLYRNNEKILAEAIGATDGTSIIFYHHSFPYKYRGRLRASNILLSAQYLISLPAQELPIMHLTSAKEVKKFVESTDEAVLLLEFCDWTFRKLAGSSLNGTDSTLGVKSWKNFGTVNYTSLCGTENGFCANCFREFILLNRTRGRKCTFEEYQNFTKFFSKFVTVARDFFLPPEKQKFGLISDRSLLSTLEVGYSGPWVALVYVVGCNSCSKILRRGDDLNDVFSSHKLLINEIEGEKYDMDPLIPTDKPSVVLFIDRTSESPRTRAKSQQAFNILKSFILNNNSSLSTWTESSRLALGHRALKGKHRHLDLKLTPPNKNMNAIDNKMSFMIINDVKGIVLDNPISVFQGNSLQDVLGYIIQQRGGKLSSLTKKAGFQLLSDDIDIERVVVESTSIKNGHDSDVSPYLSSDMHPAPTQNTQKAYVLSDVSSENLDNEGIKEEAFDDFDKTSRLKSFSGYFFFSDGGFHLLESLTSKRKVPSVVIIDPVSQQHYIFPKREVFNYSSFSGFVDRFLSGGILPFERSESLFSTDSVPHPKTGPSFDIEVSIPRISSSNFRDVVIGSKDYRSRFDGWRKDVLVLFSSNWCGFCQRMELVFGEVYIALKGYENMKTVASRTGMAESSTRDHEGFVKFPSFYIIDCTLNDCGPILRSFDQSEKYPSLLLFPSENKNAVLYEGDIKTVSIMKFISDHGRYFQNFMGNNGNRWYEEQPASAGAAAARSPKIRPGYTKGGGGGVGVGSVLVATERLAGTPLFDGSVVLVVKADRGGFHGLIVNGEEAEWDRFSELRGAPTHLKESPLSVGGPLVPGPVPITALVRTDDGSGSGPEVAYLDQEAVFREIELNGSFSGYWFFYGTATWDRVQLLEEISEGFWNVSHGWQGFRWTLPP